MEETIRKNAAEAAKAQRGNRKTRRGGTRRAGDNFLDAIYKFETSYPGGITADTLFDERTERIVRGQADRLVSTGLFPQHERDDLQQILRLALMHEMSNFKPSGCRYTFAANVCANYGKNLIVRRAKDNERSNGPVMSLDVDAGGGETYADLIQGEEPSPQEMAEHSDGVARLLESLGEDDRTICRMLLDGYTLAEIGARIGMHRVSVRYRIDPFIRPKAVGLGLRPETGGAR